MVMYQTIQFYINLHELLFSSVLKKGLLLTLKAPKKIAADDISILYFYLSKKIRLDISSKSSA